MQPELFDVGASLRRRREAALRLPPLESGHRDPDLHRPTRRERRQFIDDVARAYPASDRRRDRGDLDWIKVLRSPIWAYTKAALPGLVMIRGLGAAHQLEAAGVLDSSVRWSDSGKGWVLTDAQAGELRAWCQRHKVKLLTRSVEGQAVVSE